MSNPTGIEALVCADIAARQELGVKKYGQTVAENPLPLRDWLQHAYEESLDFPIYLRRAIAQIDGQTGGTFGEAYAFPGVACMAKGRNEAAEAISRLLDAQTKEIITLRERVAASAVECQRLTEREAEVTAQLDASRAIVKSRDAMIFDRDALLAFIDESTPRADSSCAEPGITYTEACRRALRDKQKGGA